MKKPPLCALLAMLFLLAACGQAPVRQEDDSLSARHRSDTAAAPAASTEVPAEAEPTPEALPELTPATEPVETSLAYEGDYVDEVGNRYHYLYRFPAFTDGTDDAQRLNGEIEAYITGLIGEDLNTVLENKGYSLIVYTADYEYHVNGTVVSLLCSVHNDWGMTDYLALNYDTADGRALDRGAMLALAGLDEADFAARAREALVQLAGDWSGYSDEMRAFAEAQLARTLADENLADTALFLDAEGQLTMVVRIYSMAGADYYWHLVVV